MEECAEEIVNLKIRCESQEKELEKFRSQNEFTFTAHTSQLSEKEEQIGKLNAEVSLFKCMINFCGYNKYQFN